MQALTTSWYVSYWVIDVSPIIGHFEGGAQGFVSYLGRALKLRPITPLTCSMGDKSGDRAGQACPPDILLKISLYLLLLKSTTYQGLFLRNPTLPVPESRRCINVHLVNP
jgi:hypothetical protein